VGGGGACGEDGVNKGAADDIRAGAATAAAAAAEITAAAEIAAAAAAGAVGAFGVGGGAFAAVPEWPGGNPVGEGGRGGGSPNGERGRSTCDDDDDDDKDKAAVDDDEDKEEEENLRGGKGRLSGEWGVKKPAAAAAAAAEAAAPAPPLAARGVPPPPSDSSSSRGRFFRTFSLLASTCDDTDNDADGWGLSGGTCAGVVWWSLMVAVPSLSLPEMFCQGGGGCIVGTERKKRKMRTENFSTK
jgi:hypothetical protein